MLVRASCNCVVVLIQEAINMPLSRLATYVKACKQFTLKRFVTNNLALKLKMPLKRLVRSPWVPPTLFNKNPCLVRLELRSSKTSMDLSRVQGVIGVPAIASPVPAILSPVTTEEAEEDVDPGWVCVCLSTIFGLAA